MFITIDISLPLLEIKKQLLYWLSILSNHSDSSGNGSRSVQVIVVCSHVDQVKPKLRAGIQESVAMIASQESAIEYHGLILCDCRYSSTDDINQLRKMLSSVCKSVRLFITHHETDYANRLCASLMHHIKSYEAKPVTITAGDLREEIRQLKSPTPTLIQLVDMRQLLTVCKTLSSNGHLLFLSHDHDDTNSLLVLDETTILAKVHACLADIKQTLTNKIGMLEEEQLKQTLASSLGDLIEPELAIKYLLFTQFCTQVSTDQLIANTDRITGVSHYFFSNLVRASKPPKLWSAGQQSYTHLYTWCLKCSDSHQFFTPRFLHALFIQLVKCEQDTENIKYIIWKDGILLVHNNGTRSMIEVSDQTTRVYLVIQCIRGFESHLVSQRSKYISLAKSLSAVVCPKVKLEEFVLLPSETFLAEADVKIPVSDVARSLVNSHSSVSYEQGADEVLQHVLITDLLHFDSFHALNSSTLRDVFSNRHLNDTVVPHTMLRKVCG